MKRIFFVSAALLICLTQGSPSAKADSLRDVFTFCIGIARVSIEFHGADPAGEARACLGKIGDYLAQQVGLVPFVGGPEFDGTSVSLLPGGTKGPLTFQFIDPATGLPTSGLPIGFVDYRVNLDPSMPNSFIDLGTSSNAGSHFALSYTIPHGTEPIFQAIPFSSSGDPIFIAGTGGFNDAQGLAFNATTTPESSTLLLFSSGLLGLGGIVRRRLRVSTTHVSPSQSL